ncbi:M23 family metallopeptidase [Pseudoclavibacter chungangensis]|uniref:M23 family metallopeptidase n=1 Tax=Pseudoclavibacter chungangensis TaxID=587635 RepID=A0A7J5C0V9_9MICO|nr:M23 family metallopeptidase [Pseudoclavibacter chungangensis]KAB1660376.1 M23 family metallopeptidase [Pseudoclavibacter chungangensis]NYJ65739.1 murein DD-endopeptidase MepM/ murein hydrolase activator NlpD [Pseudoclavibacter chungangensis]
MNDFTSTTATLTRRQAREIERRTGQRPVATAAGTAPVRTVDRTEQVLADAVRERLDRAGATARLRIAERLESEMAEPVGPAATVYEQEQAAEPTLDESEPATAPASGSAFARTSGSTRAHRPRTRSRRRMIGTGAGIMASAAALATAGVVAPGVVAGGTEANLLSADQSLDESTTDAGTQTASAAESAAPQGPLVPAPESVFDASELSVTQFDPSQVDGASVEAPQVTPTFVSPIPGGSMNEGYGTRGGAHNGIDVVIPGGGTCGTELQAITSGTVTFAGPQGGYGNHVELALDDGTVVSYSHLEPNGIGVSVGQRLNAGDRIGSAGTTGNSTGCHLHFEVKIGGSFVDPVPWLAANGIVL